MGGIIAPGQMTTTTADVRRTRALSLHRDAAVTFAVLLLSFAAFDDITTGNETDFTLEYGALLVGAGWLLFVTFRLIRASRAAHAKGVTH